jgi:hypothetical protein
VTPPQPYRLVAALSGFLMKALRPVPITYGQSTCPKDVSFAMNVTISRLSETHPTTDQRLPTPFLLFKRSPKKT